MISFSFIITIVIATFANCQELDEIPEPPPELKSVPSPPEAIEPEVIFFKDERSNNETQTPSAVQGRYIFFMRVSNILRNYDVVS